MTRRRTFYALATDTGASGTAEFALVLPILILFLLGTIDVGRLMWVTNMAEKATQMGARYAVVTDTLPALIKSKDYTGVVACDPDGNGVLDACKPGDLITSTAALGALACTSDGTATNCVCTGACPTGATVDYATFHRLVTWMHNFYPDVADANVVLTFRGSGLGFAGDKTGSNIVPLVTVGLQNITFTPVSLFKFVAFTLPSFATTLTDESAVGTASN